MVLREITGVSRDSNGHKRRWFHDDYFDLFVRHDEDGELVAVELCYGAGHEERALVWKREIGHFHDGPPAKGFDPEVLATRFAGASGEVPRRISSSVLRTIRDFSRVDAPRRPPRLKYRREGWQ